MRLGILLLLLTFIYNVFAGWNKACKREINSNSLISTTTETNTATRDSCKAVQIIGDSVFIDEKLYYVGDINNRKSYLDYYKLGKIISRKESYRFHSGYIPLVFGSGFTFPVGGPIILNRFYRKKSNPEIPNCLGLSESIFSKFKEGYSSIYERKLRIKSIGFGTLGSVIGIFAYFCFYSMFSSRARIATLKKE
jgi:hypothetical protein